MDARTPAETVVPRDKDRVAAAALRFVGIGGVISLIMSALTGYMVTFVDKGAPRSGLYPMIGLTAILGIAAHIVGFVLGLLRARLWQGKVAMVAVVLPVVIFFVTITVFIGLKVLLRH